MLRIRYLRRQRDKLVERLGGLAVSFRTDKKHRYGYNRSEMASEYKMMINCIMQEIENESKYEHKLSVKLQNGQRRYAWRKANDRTKEYIDKIEKNKCGNAA